MSSPTSRAPRPVPNTQALPDADTQTMQLFELQIDFFRPVWRRVVLVAICLGWAVFEFMTAAPFWGIIFGALGVYALWQLFLCRWPDDSAEH